MVPEQQLEQLIVDTFAHRTYPGDDHIAHRYPGDPCYEGEEVWEFYQGKTWREILRLGREHDPRVEPGFLSYEGFAYYLPAFLILALDLDNPLDLEDRMTTRFTFHRPAMPDLLTEAYSCQISILTPAEQRIVVQVLEHLSELRDQRYSGSTNGPRKALASYWDPRRNATVDLPRSGPNTKELLHDIGAVFADSPRPVAGRWFHRPPGGIPGESPEPWNAFEGRSWQEVLTLSRQGPPHLDPRLLTLEGFVYCLPAFLTRALESAGAAAIATPMAFVLWAFPEPIFAMLSDEQMAVTLRVLEWLTTKHVSREEGWNEAWVARSRYVGEPPTRVDYDAEKLTRNVEAAFGHRLQPAEETLVEQSRLGCLSGKADEVRKYYRGTTWQDVVRRGREPDPRITSECLSTEAFVYYLPAFLVLSLSLELPLGVRDSMILRLWLSVEEVAPALRQEEKECVREVLQALASEYDRRSWFSLHHPQAALNRYWEQLRSLL